MKKNFLIFLSIAGIAAGLFAFSSGRNPVSRTPGATLPGVQTQQSTNSKWKDGNNGYVAVPINMTNLPPHILQFLRECQHQLIWDVAEQISPADEDILLELYRQEPSLVKKRTLTIALSFIGDEEVVETFKHTLSNEYAGRKLAGTDEEMVMRETVQGLGLLANKSDSAYEFLKKGFDPKFWKDYCKFIPAEDPGLYGTLAGDAIEAIGRSGRPDVTNILEALKNQPLVNYLDTSIMQEHLESAVVDAAFANDMISQYGLNYYKQIYLDLDLCMNRMTEWKKQGNGFMWRQWRQQREGGSLNP